MLEKKGIDLAKLDGNTLFDCLTPAQYERLQSCMRSFTSSQAKLTGKHGDDGVVMQTAYKKLSTGHSEQVPAPQVICVELTDQLYAPANLLTCFPFSRCGLPCMHRMHSSCLVTTIWAEHQHDHAQHWLDHSCSSSGSACRLGSCLSLSWSCSNLKSF